MMKSFLMQLQFFTRIPIPFKLRFDEKIFAKGIIFSPVIGLVIGIFTGIVYYLVNMTEKQMPAVILAVAALVFITGGLHLDGLADTFDGIFSNRPKEKILEIMKDSRIGTNGTLSLIFIIIAKIGLLLSLNDNNIIEYLFIMPVISRMNIVWTSGISSYAGKDGISAVIIKFTTHREIIIATAITVLLSAALIRFASILVIPAAILFAVLFTRYVQKKIGGITGDIIGAIIELTEIIILISLLVFESLII